MDNYTRLSINLFYKTGLFLLIAIIFSLKGYSQNVAINASGNAPNTSAGLDVDFPNMGVLIPRVALTGTANFAPLSAHVAGMMVYNTATVADVTPGFYYNDGTKWVTGMPAGSAIGNMLYWNGTAWVLVPVGTPGQYLQMSASNIPAWGGGSFASLTTTAATTITGTTATSGGNISADGGATVLERGVCFKTATGPTIADTKVKDAGTGIGTFTSNLTGLSPVTTYYVKSYSINNSVISYGNEITFTTSAILPTVAATTAATVITGSSATTGGNVTSDGGSPITERGICYGITANPTITANTKIVDAAPGTGSFVSNITGLTGGTLYYVRAYAISSLGTTYGTQISFTTLVMPPSIVTVAATSISGASAVSGASMNWNGPGYSNYQGYGIAYSTTPNSVSPTYVATNSSNYSVNPAVPIAPWVTTITGLAANTTYYIRGYVYVYKAGWSYVYGNELSFTTTAPTAPIVGTATTATSITAVTATSGGAITSDGGSAITAKGICWGITPNPTIGIGNFTNNGTGSTTFISNLTGLTGSTTYYVRAYATNSIGTTYSPTDITFVTSPASPYTLGQNVGYGIVGYIAPDGSGFIVSPNITYTGGWGCSGTNLSTLGTAIGTGQANTNTIITNCGTSTAAGAAKAYTGGGFSDWYLPSSLEWGQIANHFTWYGINSGNYYTSSQYGTNYTYAATYFNSGPTGTCYSSGALRTNGTFMGGGILAIRNFSASPAIAPTVASTTSISNVTATSGTSGGIVASDGGSPITARGVCWNTSANPTVANSKTSDGTGMGIFTSSITGLTTGTSYYIRAYATNGVGTSYGPEIIFTPVAPGFPNVTTASISNLTASTATSGGNVISDGGFAVTARGVCWSTVTGPTTADSKTIDGSGTGIFTSNLTGLTTGTTYYLRAYATNVTGTTYGAEVSFVPFTLATLTTSAITNIAATSATSGGNISSDGGSAVTARGLCWSTSTAPTTANSTVADVPGTGIGAFVSNLTGLTNGTPYYVRAYATNGAGTAYGNELTFTPVGLTIPTLTTATVTNPTSTGGTFGGDITSDGGQPITARGVCWNQFGSPTIGDSKTIDGTGTGLFVSNITGLTAGFGYYVRAYATNSMGTAYGQQEYYVPVGSPSIAQPQLVYTAGDTFAQLVTNVISDGGDPLLAYGAVWGTSPSPTVASHLGITSENIALGWYASALISPIVQGTTYYLRCYATNSLGTTYSTEISFTPGTLTIPIVTTDPIMNKIGSVVEGGGTILSDGGDPVTVSGLCWSTSSNPTVLSNMGITTDGTTIGQYFSVMTGLTVGTTYHVRAYATNTTGTAYGVDISFVATAAIIGQVIQGGWLPFGNIFYVDGTGSHGLMGLTFSNSPADWGCTSSLTGASGTALFTGLNNTNLISADITTNNCTSAGPFLQFAAPLTQVQLGTFLPSKDEMNILWNNRVSSGLDLYLAPGMYWSSSEVDATHAWCLDTTTPTPTWISTGTPALKTAQYNAWPIWSF